MPPEPAPARLADPGSSARQPFRREAARERPVHEWTAVGPWAGHVTIVPVSPGTRLGAHFEVRAAWGSPELGFDVPGLTGRPVAQAADAEMIPAADDGLELARALAMAAVDELRVPRAPDLPALRRRFENRAK